jgi:hypothetical protein
MSGVCVTPIDQKWVERNLGFDPIDMPPPASTFAFSRAAQTSNPEDLQREIIDFDSASPAGLQFLAFTTATGLEPPGFIMQCIICRGFGRGADRRRGAIIERHGFPPFAVSGLGRFSRGAAK